MTGLDESGVFHVYYSMFSEVKSGGGGSAIGHSFPTRERGGGRPCHIHEGLGAPWNWRTGVKGRRGKQLGEGRRAVRLLKTIRGHPDVAEQRKATDELSDGKGRRALPQPNMPPAN